MPKKIINFALSSESVDETGLGDDFGASAENV